jgi:MoaA/NifB/PqqE/SkfB family radical SAM enzyme
VKLEKIGFYTLSEERVKNASVCSQMKRGEIIITEYCNFKCPYCRGLDKLIFSDRKIKQLSLEEIKQIIDYWCVPLPIENIRLSGGEPTLHKDIIEIVKYAKNKQVKRIAISTNGSNRFSLYQDLINAGCNDFSVSLDACCAADGDKMAGNIRNSWDKVISNIEKMSKLTYVTVGIVLTEQNINSVIETVKLAHKLGVADIRIISSAQWNQPIPQMAKIDKEILDIHPILKYRVQNFIEGGHVRGLNPNSCNKCGLVLDDSAIAGIYHYPCIIYMREKGKPIGLVSNNMRKERFEWYKKHNSLQDEICSRNCLDVCENYNKKFEEYHAY